MTQGTKESCECATCVSACQHRPGWFLPGEAEKVAEHLEIPLQELFDKKLGVDWWQDEPDIFVLTPAIEGYEGDMYPGNPDGCCVFFVDDKCAIHPVKPHECRTYVHTDLRMDQAVRHMKVADAWREEKQQELVKTLLGREPVSSTFTAGGILGGWW